MAHASWTNQIDGQRLDRSIADAMDCSRGRARAFLEAGLVQVDGRPAQDKGLRLAVDQEISVLASGEHFDAVLPVEAPLAILAQGSGWVAVDKPAGLPVHPLRPEEEDSLLQRVVARFPEIMGVGEGGLRSGVVHRLDVDTSGVQIFALDQRTWSGLRQAFSGHRIDKVYRALVHGIPPEHGAVELDLEITRHRPARVQAAAAGAGSKDSRRCPLRFRRLEELGRHALVEVRPRTGFLHQIRVSFAFLGHPLVGDALYGQADAPRQMLHASRITLGEIEALAPDPPDFSAVLAQLRG